jgi:hypothetical protein
MPSLPQANEIRLLADAALVASIAALAVLVVAGAAGWWILVVRRRDVWRRFARRHRLKVIETGVLPRLEGTVHGRPFVLAAASGGSDAEEFGIVDVELSLGLFGPLPERLEMEDATGVIGEAQRVLEGHTISTGDAEFDHSVVVRGADAGAVQAYLDPGRRQAFRDLVERHASGEVGLAAGRIYLRDRELVSSLEELESRLSLLRQAAPAFDATEPTAV